MSKRGSKPVVLITSGDPAGIGPEIIIKALKKESINKKALFIVIGDKFAFEAYVGKVNIISSINDLKDDVINLIPVSNIKKLKFGKPDKYTALSSYKALEKAVELIKKGFSNILITGPIFKKGIIDAGINFVGHTEFLQKSFAVKDVLMSFIGKRLFVGTVTTHVPLVEVGKLIRKNIIKSKIEIATGFLKNFFSKTNPDIAILGLNPHCGEGGKIGAEDEKIIRPLCEEYRKKGFNIYGPLSADVAFYEAYNGKFDFILGMYHDQVLPPFKMLYFEEGVNITMGLPFIRTSPDHGTGFDIAGKGIASERSFEQAIKLSLKINKNWIFNENKFWY